MKMTDEEIQMLAAMYEWARKKKFAYFMVRGFPQTTADGKVEFYWYEADWMEWVVGTKYKSGQKIAQSIKELYDYVMNDKDDRAPWRQAVKEAKAKVEKTVEKKTKKQEEVEDWEEFDI